MILHAPKRVLFGNGSLKELSYEIDLIGANKILLVTSTGMLSRPFFAFILQVLSFNGRSFRLLTINTEPTTDDLNTCFSAAHDFHPDLIIGVGGGSVMDTAKALSCMYTNHQPLKAMAGDNKVVNQGPPILLVPTIAGSGSEVTHESVLTDIETGTRFAIKDAKLLASCSIVDPQISSSCLVEDALTTGIDAFVHAIESIGNLNANIFSNHYALKGLSLLYEGLIARSTNCDQATLTLLSSGSMMAGFAFASTGTAAVHALGYPLTAKFAIKHGVANAVLLPYVLAYNLKFTDCYKPINDLFNTNDLVDFLANFIHQLGFPTQISSLGIQETNIDELALITLEDTRHLSVNPVAMSLQHIQTIFHAALVGDLKFMNKKANLC